MKGLVWWIGLLMSTTLWSQHVINDVYSFRLVPVGSIQTESYYNHFKLNNNYDAQANLFVCYGLSKNVELQARLGYQFFRIPEVISDSSWSPFGAGVKIYLYSGLEGQSNIAVSAMFNVPGTGSAPIRPKGLGWHVDIAYHNQMNNIWGLGSNAGILSSGSVPLGGIFFLMNHNFFISDGTTQFIPYFHIYGEVAVTDYLDFRLKMESYMPSSNHLSYVLSPELRLWLFKDVKLHLQYGMGLDELSFDHRFSAGILVHWFGY